MKTFFSILAILGCTIFSGCASIPMAETDLDSQAKSFQTYGKLSNIYVYRPPGVLGWAVRNNIKLDSHVVGRIANGDFMLLVVPPGHHTINSREASMTHSLGDFIGYEGKGVSVDVNAQPGGKYFILLEGHYIKKLSQVDEATGRADVSACNLTLTEQSLSDAMRANFAPPDKISVPKPISGKKGKYLCPITAAGTVAAWAQGGATERNNGSDLAANLGGAIGRQVANKALDFVPFGLGGLIGQQLGESVGRSATSKPAELPTEDAMKASSDISFNSSDALALYMYAKYSTQKDYFRVLALTQQIYPELSKSYFTALEKASRPYLKKKKA